MTQQILGISGKKKSGKNTLANYTAGLELIKLGVVRRAVSITPKGELWISDLYGDTDYEGILDLNRRDGVFLHFLDENVSPYIKLYAFADLMKRNICIDIFGMDEKILYGTDEEKNNTLSNLYWDNMPADIGSGHLGQMTYREVLQYIGTNVFRSMNDNVWVDALIRKVKAEDSQYAVITDARFPNEVTGIQNAGGKVIRLTRQSSDDSHASESSLDDFNGYDAVVDNQNMDLNETVGAFHKVLQDFGFAPGVS